MAQQDDDDPLRIPREIAHEAETAFVDIPYPGDDRLLRFDDYYENDDILESFQGKHWKEISPETLFKHTDNLGSLSPEAYRFYLPACIIGALLHHEETDRLFGSIFYSLRPPVSKGERMDEFCACIAPLDVRQKTVLRRYVDFYVEVEDELEDPGKDRALLFWQRLTDLERNGARPRDQESAIQNIYRAMGWKETSAQEAREAKLLEQEIAREVEEAFATVAPPEDDGSPDAAAQWKSVPEAFRGKHWRDLSPEVLRQHDYQLKYFSTAAFRFFLPAYLVAALVHPDETNDLRDHLFYNLLPRREQGYWMDWFHANVAALDARQKAVVLRFMELWARTATCYPDAIKERGIAFWRQVTSSPSTT